MWRSTWVKAHPSPPRNKLHTLEPSQETTSRPSIQPVQQRLLETPFFQRDHEGSVNSEHGGAKFDLLSNVCVCLIDIVGFSAWCSNHLPGVIATAMLAYNDWLGAHASEYPSISKIELVGDSCLLVADRVDDGDLVDTYLDTIRFAVDLIEDIDIFRNLFRCPTMAIRIGVHVSDVIGLFVSKPRKYQLFGNDINVCSRLESSCVPNSVHVSAKTLMCVQQACRSTCGPCTRCIRSAPIDQSYKGVGVKTSYQLFLKKPTVCLLSVGPVLTDRIRAACPMHQFHVPLTPRQGLLDCLSFRYTGVVLCAPESGDPPELASLRANPHFHQRVLLLSGAEHQTRFDIDAILSLHTATFLRDMRALIDDWCTPAATKCRGSLDISLLTAIE